MGEAVALSARMKRSFLWAQKNYLKRLNRHILEYRRVREMLSHGYVPAGEVAKLLLLTQNFIGSGATFGFPEISVAARDLYEEFKKIAGLRRADGPVDTEPVLTALHAFEAACRNAMQVDLSGHDVVSTAPEIKGAAKIVGLVGDSKISAKAEEALMAKGYQVVSGEDIEAVLRKVGRSGLLHAMASFGALSDADLALLQVMRANGTFLNEGTPLIAVQTAGHFQQRLEYLRAGFDAILPEGAGAMNVLWALERLTLHRRAVEGRVLVVVADEMIAAFYDRALRHGGMEVVQCNGAAAAMQALAQGGIDAMVINEALPECSGLELAGIVRQEEMKGLLPVLVLAAAEPGVAEAARARRLHVHMLAKPFAPEQLLNSVQGFLKEKIRLACLASSCGYAGQAGA